MSLIQFAQSKDAVNFQKTLHEKIQQKVDTALAETKVLVAGGLLDEAGGITGGVKRVYKKPKPGHHGASAPEPHVPGGHQPGKSKHVKEGINEKLIAPGDVDHMAHAVHDCATGNCEPTTTRGTFSVYHTPHYVIHKDHGGIHPDKAEHHYFVAGGNGMHKFSVHHGAKGVDVKHHGQVG